MYSLMLSGEELSRDDMVSALDAAHSCGCYEKSWLPAAAAAQAAVNGARAAP